MDAGEKIARLEAMLQKDSNDPLTHFLLGRECMAVNRLEDGTRAFERCVQLNPDYTAAYRFLGDCHRRSGDMEAAARVYEAGIATAARTGDGQAGREMEALLRKLKTP
ncbi:hypothetical protein HZA57_07645 [Candidatus Poribacteria bacterium]|nr:hypothetical protein [Candidatus Poribacteria bacterium]